MQKLTDKQELWLSALESGTYRQGRNRLKSGDQFCCLGVACIVLGYEFDSEDMCLGHSHHLPELVQDALGLQTAVRPGDKAMNHRAIERYIKDSFGLDVPYTSLEGLNDGALTFKQIAQLLRAFPELYFPEDFHLFRAFREQQ